MKEVKTLKIKIYPNQSQQKLIDDNLKSLHECKTYIINKLRENTYTDERLKLAYYLDHHNYYNLFSYIWDKVLKPNQLILPPYLSFWYLIHGLSESISADSFDLILNLEILKKKSKGKESLVFKNNSPLLQIENVKKLISHIYKFEFADPPSSKQWGRTPYAIYLTGLGWVKLKDKVATNNNPIKNSYWQYVKENTFLVKLQKELDCYYIYLLYKSEHILLSSNKRVVGIDVGVKNTLTLSTGEVFQIPLDRIKEIDAQKHKVRSIIAKKKQINKMRGKLYSKKVKELQLKDRKLTLKLKNIKRDFYHKVVKYLVRKYEYIAVEDLDLNQLARVNGKNSSLYFSFHRIALSYFFQMLEYKAKIYNRKILKVDPSLTSKTCSHCGWVNHNLTLNDRIFHCSKCGLVMDRDLNAAINIRMRGIILINNSITRGGTANIGLK